MKLRPEILQHPQIPKPLHGISPRSIMGQTWWDKQRFSIFNKQKNRCAVTGIHKNDFKHYTYLECHEIYDINYQTGEVKFVELVGLSPLCHRFIHSGLLKVLYKTGRITKEFYEEVMTHGFNILADAGLEPNVLTLLDWLYHTLSLSDTEIGKRISHEQYKQLCEVKDNKIAWKSWYLLYNGKKYYSKFKNEKEWELFYRRNR